MDPVIGAVLRSIFDLAAPDVSRGNGLPQIGHEAFVVKSGIDDPVVLADKLFPLVFGNLTKLIVNVSDDSAAVGNRYDGGFVQCKFDINQLL